MEKIIKMYTLVWKKESRDIYCVPKKDHGVIPLEYSGIKYNISKKKIGRPKIREATVFPFFDTKQEAEGYREGNNDFMVVEVKIMLNL